MEGLVQILGGATTVSPEFICFHEFGSAVTVDSSIMILTPICSCGPYSLSLTVFLAFGLVLRVDLCI